MEDIQEPLPTAEQSLWALIQRAELDEDLHLPATMALEWYDNSLPYHNQDHMFEVADTVLSLCEKRGIKGYSRQALFMAALWHDADYGTPLDDQYETKEHRSAALAYQAIMSTAALGEEGDSLQSTRMFAEHVASLIISTIDSREPKTELEVIMNEADLANLQGETQSMLRRSGAYFVEGLVLDGRVIAETIEQTLKENADEFSVWCHDTITHLEKVMVKKFGKSTSKLVGWSESIVEAISANIIHLTPAAVLQAFAQEDDAEEDR